MKTLIILLLFITSVSFGQSNIYVKDVKASGTVTGSNFYKVSMDSIFKTAIATEKLINFRLSKTDTSDYSKVLTKRLITINPITSTNFYKGSFDSVLITKTAAQKLVNGVVAFPYVKTTGDDDIFDITTMNGGFYHSVNQNNLGLYVENNYNNFSVIDNNYDIHNQIYNNYNIQNNIDNNYKIGSLINNKQNSSTALKSVGITTGDSLRIGGGNTAIQLFTVGAKTFELDRLGNISCKSITAIDGLNIFPYFLSVNNYEDGIIKTNYNYSTIIFNVENYANCFYIGSNYNTGSYIQYNYGLGYLVTNTSNSATTVKSISKTQNDSLIFGTGNNEIRQYYNGNLVSKIDSIGKIFANSYQTDTLATAQSPNKSGLIWYGNGSTITNGAIGSTIITLTTNTTLDKSHNVVLCNSASTFTITLPAANTCQYRTYKIKNINTGEITIDANSTETIDGDLTQLLVQYDAITIISNGTNWFIL